MSAQNFQALPNVLAPKMPNALVQKAIKLFSVPSTTHNETSISLYICARLKEMGVKYKIDDYGNIIATKGVGPYPCFCAHLDTVHMYHKGFHVRTGQNEEKTRMYLYAVDDKQERVGVGGDDKCGIFVCLYLLQNVKNVKCVFFSREETGGEGSGGISKTVFLDCAFLGSVDRWNGKDFINKYQARYTISKEFKDYVTPLLEEFGYTYTSGLFTDAFNVMERDIGISCFNISCGYYSHHSSSEYVDTSELYWSCLLCAEIALNTDRIYTHVIKKRTYAPYVSAGVHYATNWKLRDTSTGTHTDRYCRDCGLELLSYEKVLCYWCEGKQKQNKWGKEVYDNYFD